MAKTMKEGLKTVLIIAIIYVLFFFYLLFVSDRVEKLDNKSNEEQSQITLKIGQ